MQQEAPKEPNVTSADHESPGAPETDHPQESEAEIVLPDEQKSDEQAVLEAQVAEWKDLAMRATADLDNFRKRMAREKSEALQYANQALLEDLLPVLDNFEIGLQAAANEEESMIYQGMRMVKRQFDEFLEAQGVREVPAEGQPFDPNLHEAVAQEESGEFEEGTILRVVRRGFAMRDRLLRPANVVVAMAPGEH